MKTKRTDIYFNLHKKKLSVRSREKESYGRVISHEDAVLLTNCRFVVSEAGRQRVVRERKKNVHAVVRGDLIHEWGDVLAKIINKRNPLDQWQVVTYNPYRYETFVTMSDQKPIHEADFVFIVGKDMVALTRVGV